jgi:hypothetical protein
MICINEEVRMNKKKLSIFVGAALLVVFGAATAAPFEIKDLIRDLISIPAVLGNEEALAAKILSYLPKNITEKDNLGSLFARFGTGEPKIRISIVISSGIPWSSQRRRGFSMGSSPSRPCIS